MTSSRIAKLSIQIAAILFCTGAASADPCYCPDPGEDLGWCAQDYTQSHISIQVDWTLSTGSMMATSATASGFVLAASTHWYDNVYISCPSIGNYTNLCGLYFRAPGDDVTQASSANLLADQQINLQAVATPADLMPGGDITRPGLPFLLTGWNPLIPALADAWAAGSMFEIIGSTRTMAVSGNNLVDFEHGLRTPFPHSYIYSTNLLQDLSRSSAASPLSVELAQDPDATVSEDVTLLINVETLGEIRGVVFSVCGTGFHYSPEPTRVLESTAFYEISIAVSIPGTGESTQVVRGLATILTDGSLQTAGQMSSGGSINPLTGEIELDNFLLSIPIAPGNAADATVSLSINTASGTADLEMICDNMTCWQQRSEIASLLGSNINDADYQFCLDLNRDGLIDSQDILILNTTPMSFDYNCDGVVDLQDIYDIVDNATAADLAFDFNGDGVVDADDLVHLLDITQIQIPYGDANRDGEVDCDDLMLLLNDPTAFDGQQFGEPGYRVELDANMDGVNDETDRAIIYRLIQPADLTGPSSSGVPDGIVDADDFFYFNALFANGDPAADLTGSDDPNSPDWGVPNGIVDADDFFYFLAVFAQGCN